jgi:hypothetical protein
VARPPVLADGSILQAARAPARRTAHVSDVVLLALLFVTVIITALFLIGLRARRRILDL